VAEHSVDLGHRIQFHNASIIATKTRYGDHWDWAPPQQYEQRGGFLSQKVIEASHLLPQETSWTWRQIYKATQVNTRSAALAPRLLGQCSLGSPGFFPTPENFPPPALFRSLLPASLAFLPDLYRPYWFPMWLTHPPSFCSYLAGCFRLVAQSATHLLTLVPRSRFFYPEDGGDMCLRNVCSYKIYTAPHHRRRHISVLLNFVIIIIHFGVGAVKWARLREFSDSIPKIIVSKYGYKIVLEYKTK
jgi:hypothetical protein